MSSLVGLGDSVAMRALVKFDLDFPGGTPRQLVEAIDKGSGKTLNAIVPDEFANLHLPAIKMKAVTVYELFQALHEVAPQPHWIQ